MTLFVIILSFLDSPSFAKDLHGRLGLGYNGQFANSVALNGVPGVSLKYAFTRDLGVQGIFGFSTSTPSNLVTALKLYKNLFYDTNLNFYCFLGGGIVAANSINGAQFLTGFGTEFFIPGVESVGFSMETGISGDNLSGAFVIKTLGISFIQAGIHFYL